MMHLVLPLGILELPEQALGLFGRQPLGPQWLDQLTLLSDMLSPSQSWRLTISNLARQVHQANHSPLKIILALDTGRRSSSLTIISKVRSCPSGFVLHDGGPPIASARALRRAASQVRYGP
jgi:hypothetical protein